MDQSITPYAEPERWLPVVGYEGLYEVSDLGRVRSLPRNGTRGGILTCSTIAGHPYLRVGLTRNRVVQSPKVHILVARAFLGLPPPGHEVCHGPGGALDNRLVNLSYGTHSKNCGEDMRRDGTALFGMRATNVKLNDEAVRECRARAAAGEAVTALACEFGVTPSAMQNAVTGRTWRHLPAPIPELPRKPRTRPPVRRRRGGVDLPRRSANLHQVRTGLQRNNKSGYRGVYWHLRSIKWVARIKVDGRQVHLGCFDDPVEAARAYNRAALEAFGEFAWLNPLPDTVESPAA